MPKLLVLFDASEPALAQLADAIAAGARTVRFAEVDVRRAGDGATDGRWRHRALGGPEEFAQYDGIVLGVPEHDGSGPGAAESTLTRFEGSLANKVGSAFTAAEGAPRRETLWRALAPMADRGMILVPAPLTGPSDEAALGARLAEVIAWVTHARSHHHHH
ncbi:MAG TPA: hypothetical protein VL328_03175 [Gemmatimonadaceae bacterium]|jgi:hypothetical protein|nr:hypothetical protein [Gemmatimonadaceae bacterium]